MLDYIRQLLNLIFAISVMYMLLDCEIKHNKNRYLLGLYATIVLICDGFVLLNFGHAHFVKIYPLLVHLPVFLGFVFVSKFKGIKLLFVFFTVFVLYTPIIGIALIISSLFGFNRVILNVVCYILYIPTGFIVYRYIRPSFLYMLRNTDKGWFGFCTIPLSYYALIYFIGMQNVTSVTTKSTLVIMVLALILTLAAYVMILRFFKQTREHLTLENEQNLLKTQVAAARVHLEALKESQEKTIIYRHDIRHHLNLINAYLTDNNKAAAQKYITDVENTIEDATVEKYCRNYAVNLILSSYLEKAKNEEITIETQIDLPEKTAISDMDLCVIYANAIENAVNACKRIANPKDRTLKVVSKTKNDKLFIQITNSYAGTVVFVDDIPINTEENHGLGTKSIVAVAQKYSGVYSFVAEDGVFKTSIIL